MEKISNPPLKIILPFLLLFTIVINSTFVNSRHLPSTTSPSPSPSPAPVGEEVIVKNLKGSNPAKCESKCNLCNPCMPIQVSITTLDQLKDNIDDEFYYPQVWKCVCGDHIFSP